MLAHGLTERGRRRACRRCRAPPGRARRTAARCCSVIRRPRCTAIRCAKPSSRVKRSGPPKDSAVNMVRWSTCVGPPGAEQRLEQRVAQHAVVEGLLEAVQRRPRRRRARTGSRCASAWSCRTAKRLYARTSNTSRGHDHNPRLWDAGAWTSISGRYAPSSPWSTTALRPRGDALASSQQGLSKRVARLEGRLGPLLERRAGGVRLTPAGERLLPRPGACSTSQSRRSLGSGAPPAPLLASMCGARCRSPARALRAVGPSSRIWRSSSAPGATWRSGARAGAPRARLGVRQCRPARRPAAGGPDGRVDDGRRNRGARQRAQRPRRTRSRDAGGPRAHRHLVADGRAAAPNCARSRRTMRARSARTSPPRPRTPGSTRSSAGSRTTRRWSLPSWPPGRSQSAQTSGSCRSVPRLTIRGTRCGGPRAHTPSWGACSMRCAASQPDTAAGRQPKSAWKASRIGWIGTEHILRCLLKMCPEMTATMPTARVVAPLVSV